MANKTDKNIKPPKPSTTQGNGHGKTVPSGPSKKVRDEYLKKVEEIVKRKKKPGEK